MKHSIFRSRRGFTLAELVAVIAIIAILVSLGATGYFALRKSMRITEYDDIAREIYIAAQNRLTSLRANGLSAEDSAALTSVSKMGTKPQDWEDTDENGYTLDWDTAKGNYYYADNQQANSANVLELLLPLGSVDDAVRSNGCYVIEYNPVTGTVYGVFYSESTFVYAAVIGDETSNFRTDRTVRKAADPMVGYYGGSAVVRDELEVCGTPELTIENTDVLKLTVDNAVTHNDYTVAVSVSDGKNVVNIANGAQSGEYNPITGTLILDELDGEHFHELFPTLTPGADITITVTFSKDGMLSSSASVTVNSLFASREDSDTGAAVEIAYARQLQNLDPDTSGLSETGKITARQIANIDWATVSTSTATSTRSTDFTSITNTALTSYDGQYYTISNLKGTNGLFAAVAAGTQLLSIRIVNPTISAAGTGNVGALAGTVGAGTTVSNCGVYCDATTTTGGVTTVNYTSYTANGYGITAPSATAGGLIGSADTVTITNSFAALPFISAKAGGALVGSATNCDITMSYAACDSLGSTDIAYFLSGSGNSITKCYAVGNIASKESGSFVFGTENNITSAYYAVSHAKYRDSGAREDLSATEYAAYSTSGGVIKYDTYESFTAAEGGVADAVGQSSDGSYTAFTPVTAPLTHPYRAALNGREYPYPGFYMLEHYGSWPDGNGTVDVNIYMRLRNNSAYAYYAGHVQVWSLELDEDGDVATDSNGNEMMTLLYDNYAETGENRTVYSGENDTVNGTTYKKLSDSSSYITLSVTPGTTIRVTVTQGNEEYTFLSLTFNGNSSSTTDFQILYDTDVTVTFQPKNYTLTTSAILVPTDSSGETYISNTAKSYYVHFTANSTNYYVYAGGSANVSAGTTVTVAVKYPQGYVEKLYTRVVTLTYTSENGEPQTNSITLTEDGIGTFTMPTADATISVKYVPNASMNEVTVNYYVQDSEGEYPKASSETRYYETGTVINQTVAQSLSSGSGRETTVEYDENGETKPEKVLDYSYFVLTKDKDTKASDGKDSSAAAEYTIGTNDTLTLDIYIARKTYELTLFYTENDHIVSVAASYGNETQTADASGNGSVTATLYYDQSVTAKAVTEAGQTFTMWTTEQSAFGKKSSAECKFSMPCYDLQLEATAKKGEYLVTLELTENGESWLSTSQSRKDDPITIMLVDSTDSEKTYQMDALTGPDNSYTFQCAVPAITTVGEGYYVLIKYDSGLEIYYTDGDKYYGSDGVHADEDGDDRKLLLVHDKALTDTLAFYTITYYPNTSSYSGSVPDGGTYPANSRIKVQGNPNLLVNKVTSYNKKQYLIGWRDGQESLSTSTVYTQGQYILLTRKTDFYAEWSTGVNVTYEEHATIKATSGSLPMASNETPGSEYTVKDGVLRKDGYDFDGWTCSYTTSCTYIPKGQSGKTTVTGSHTHQTGDKIIIEGSLTLTAAWKKGEYTVTYYDCDGTAHADYDSTKYTIEDTLTVKGYNVTNPSWAQPEDGSTFVGWKIEPTGTKVNYTADAVIKGLTENLTLYPVFTSATVTVTYHYGENTATQTVGYGTTVFLEPTDGNTEGWTVTAWCLYNTRMGENYLCTEDTLRTVSAQYVAPDMNEDGEYTLDLYAVYAESGKVYNVRAQAWYGTLYEAVNDEGILAGDTLIVYRDTTETKRIEFSGFGTGDNGGIYVIASGNRTVKWADSVKSSALSSNVTGQIGDNEFCGCMFINDCAVTFGESNLENLDVSGTLTFDANKKSRVMALKGSNCTFTMVDGVTLTNGKVDGEVYQNARISPNDRQYMGGGVYAADGAYFNMEGGTISYCKATAGGGVYIVGVWKNNKWKYISKFYATTYDNGASFSMGSMEYATEYSAEKIYYEVNPDVEGAYQLATDDVTVYNYRQYYVTTGNPQIIYNTAEKDGNDDGGGGIVLLEVEATAINLFSGSISNNTAKSLNGGGIILDTSENGQQLRLYEIEISNNTALKGGGIYQYQGTTYIYNAEILQNKATENGGGIYANCATSYKGQTLDLDDNGNKITDSTKITQGDGNHEVSQILFYYGTIRENEAGDSSGLGGGIYLAAPDSTSLVSVVISEGKILNNSAYNGGGIYLPGATTCTDTELKQKYAQTCTVTVTVNGGEILNNNAIHLGGGIYVSEKVYFYLNGGYISGNTAEMDEKGSYKCDITTAGDYNKGSYAWIYTTSQDLAQNLENDSDDPIYIGGYSSSGTTGSKRVNGRIILKYETGAVSSNYDADCFAYTNGKANFGTGDSGKTTVYVKLVVDKDNPNGKLIFTTTADKERTVVFSYNYTNSEGKTDSYSPENTEIGDKILYSTVKEEVTRTGYDLIGWSKVENAEVEQYEIYYQDGAVYMSYDATQKFWQYKAMYTEETKTWTWYSHNTASDWTPIYKYEDGTWYSANDATTDTWTKMTDPSTRSIADITSDEGEPVYKVTSAYSQKLYAQWKAYAVTYDLGKAPNTVAMADEAKDYADDNAYVKLRSPSPDHYTADGVNYTFKGWSTEQNQTELSTDNDWNVNLAAGTVIQLSKSVTLYAVWQPDTVTVTYEPNGGSGSHSDTISYGASTTAWDGSETFLREGYMLTGWSTNQEGTGKTYALNGTIPASDIGIGLTLYAVWQPKVTVVYNGGGVGEDSSAFSYAGGTVILPEATATTDGYIFDHWEDTSGGTYEAGTEFKVPSDATGSVILKAVWKMKVTFKTGGGTLPDSYTQVEENSEYYVAVDNGILTEITLPTPIWDGGTFTGWTDGDARLLNAGDSYTVSAPVTFTAQWDCTVMLDLQSGTLTNGGEWTAQADGTYTQTVAKSDTASVTLPNVNEMARTGYTFGGWSTKADSSEITNAGGTYSVSCSITLYAIWTANDNTVTLDANGGTFTADNMTGWDASEEDGTYKKTEQKTGTTITLPNAEAVTIEDATKTLAGWATTKEKAEAGTPDAGEPGETYTVPATEDETVTLYAVWKTKTYTVTLDLGGGTLADTETDWEKETTEDETTEDVTTYTQTVDVNTVLTLPTPTMEGYTFDGWYYVGEDEDGNEEEIVMEQTAKTDDDDNEVKDDDGNPVMEYKYQVTGDITITAKWTETTETEESNAP